jgi:hypothetical protein
LLPHLAKNGFDKKRGIFSMSFKNPDKLKKKKNNVKKVISNPTIAAKSVAKKPQREIIKADTDGSANHNRSPLDDTDNK